MTGRSGHNASSEARGLASKLIQQARIEAFKTPMLGEPNSGFRGGLVLGDGDDDWRLRHTRGRVPVDSFDPDARFDEELSGHYAYGGMTHTHFGHFMAEMVHRIVPSLRHDPNHKMLFVNALGHRRNRFDLLPEHVQEVYSLLGLGPDNVHVVTRNTTVESIYVSESGSDLGTGPADAYLDILDGIIERKLDELFGSGGRGKCLYVSRSKLPAHGGLFGERYLEAALEAEGYEIFHPQDHSVAVQMDQYRKAEVVIFLEGSACHGAELFGRNVMQTCILLARKGAGTKIERLLRPRAQLYAKCASHFLGSMYVLPDGRSARNKGVSLLHWDALVELLRNLGAARLSAASESGYMAAATEDFHRYLGTDESGGALTIDAEIRAGLVDRFAAARAAM